MRLLPYEVALVLFGQFENVRFHDAALQGED